MAQLGYITLIDLTIFLLAFVIFLFLRGKRGDANDVVLPNWSHADAATKELFNERFSKKDVDVLERSNTLVEKEGEQS